MGGWVTLFDLADELGLGPEELFLVVHLLGWVGGWMNE